MLRLTFKRQLLEASLFLLKFSLFFAVLISVVSLYFDWTGDFCSSWFQRSGSILVLGGAAREFQFFTIDALFKITKFEHEQKSQANLNLTARCNKTLVYTDVARLDDKVSKLLNIIQTIPISHTPSLIAILFGTLIWGYGDLIVSNIRSCCT